MKYHLLYATLFLASTTPINSQITYFDTIYARDNIQGELKSGFYHAVADTSKSRGFKVYNKDEYYFIAKAPVVTMEEVDTIYKQYHSFMERHVLIFKFNKTATNHWSDFTKRYQNQQVALFLKDTLVFVATIAGQITDGVS
jgi:preprotein translocase subunit SecD